MSLTVDRPLPAFLTLVVLLACATPAYARGEARGVPAHKTRPLTTAQRIALYAPRVRRSTVMYLRLRLLELRENGLDRARAAIEHRLSIDDLLAEPDLTRHAGDERKPPASQPPRP